MLLRRAVLAVALAGTGLTAASAPSHASSPRLTAPAVASPAAFDAVVADIQAQPYQAAYVPVGLDSAFTPDPVVNTAPAQDYTSGSIPGSPDAPNWPAAFKSVTITSTDGAILTGELAIKPGTHPGVLVVHGFNTHGDLSVIRWAAMLAANGYNVLAADQRDFSFEYSAGYGHPKIMQTFGWKEAEDVLAAGRYLAAQPGVSSVGVVGFSEGAQNVVLALAADHAGAPPVFQAGLTFSGPADQDTQVYSTAAPPKCQTPSCTYPATDALIALVVPPYTYTDPCRVLADAATLYGTTPYDILTNETAFHAQRDVNVPLLNYYAADDPLVAPAQATMMAGYEQGNSLQRTIELQHGLHAYYFDRWWQQQAILRYFKAMLAGASTDATLTVAATVNQTPGGTAASEQVVDIGNPTTAIADAQVAPYICDTSQPPPASRTATAAAPSAPPPSPSVQPAAPSQPAATDPRQLAATGGHGPGPLPFVLLGLAVIIGATSRRARRGER
jgi:predicted alpha/beta-fold hydrolase